jgi:hypothetical protein
MSLVLFVIFFHLLPMRSDLHGGDSVAGGQVLFILAGAGLAAWAALESSVPAESLRGRWQAKTALFLWALAAVWALTASPGPWTAYWPALSMHSCFVAVFLSGLVSWAGLVLLLARNAPTRAFRAGLWAGLSAFLLGLGAVTLHCPSGDLFHVCMEHFLPVLIYSGVMAWAGVGWLSGWKKKPLPPVRTKA